MRSGPLATTLLKEFLTNFNPSSSFRELKEVTTIEKSLSSNTPSIWDISKAYGDSKTEAYIKLWLIDLNEFLNLRRSLSEIQIEQIAISILQDYRNLKISDINLIFSRAKKGYYGEFYESISMPKILGWFRDYYDDRINTAGEIARRNHSNITALERKNSFDNKNEKESKAQEFFKESHKVALEQYTSKFK